MARGGAISAAGAAIHIRSTRFINCTSLGYGGGAILATNFICYGSETVFNTVVNIESSTFEGCSSRGSGGAVVVTSSLASISVSASLFMACRSDRQGGAVASIDGGTMKLVDSIFVNNSASGHGGGALYADNAQLVLLGVSAHGNSARSGGGGVLYWIGQAQPNVLSWCGQGAYPDPASACNPTSCSASCLPCQEGTYLTGSGAESKNSCMPCEAGTYSSLPGSTHCFKCSAGYFSTTKGATHSSVCAACEPGFYMDLSAATACALCEAGTYSSEMGCSTCLSCPPGTYLLSSGASYQDACMECPAGFFSHDVGSFCRPCDAGSYTMPMATACTTCPEGTFASEPGSADCVSCTPGKFSGQGAGSCTVCLAGTFSSGFGMNSSGSCSLCGDGLFAGRGAERCLPIDGFRAGVASNVFSSSNGNKLIIVPLAFPFHFYGEEYWNVTVSIYGILAMGECILDFQDVIFRLEQSIIAVFWQHLVASDGNGFIQWSDNNTITFQWTNWATFSGAGVCGSLTFQISLMRNGTFLLSYVELDGKFSGGELATVGFQGRNHSPVILSQNENPLHSGMCYTVSPDPSHSTRYFVEQYACPETIRLLPTCRPGQFLGSDYQCEACPAGTYQTGEGMQNKKDCSICAPGSFPHYSGATAADDCGRFTGDNSSIGTLKSEDNRRYWHESPREMDAVYLLCVVENDPTCY